MTHKCFNVIIRLSRTTAPPNPYGQYHAHLPHLATSHQEAKRNLSTPEYQHLDLWPKSVENKVGYHCLSKVDYCFLFFCQLGKNEIGNQKQSSEKEKQSTCDWESTCEGQQASKMKVHQCWKVDCCCFIVFPLPASLRIDHPWLLLLFVFPQGWLSKVVDCCFYFFLNQPAMTYAMKAHQKVDCCFFVFPLLASLHVDHPWLLLFFVFLKDWFSKTKVATSCIHQKWKPINLGPQPSIHAQIHLLFFVSYLLHAPLTGIGWLLLPRKNTVNKSVLDGPFTLIQVGI